MVEVLEFKLAVYKDGLYSAEIWAIDGSERETIELFLEIPLLKAMELFVPRGTPNYLAYVFVDFLPHQQLTFATDGIAAFLANSYRHTKSSIVDVAVPIPIKLIRQIKKKKKGTLTLQAPAFPMTVHPNLFETVSMLATKDPTGEPAQYDCEYLANFQRAADLLDIGRPYIHYNGPERAALITFEGSEDYIGVIMPWRFVEAPSIPGWLEFLSRKRG